MPPHPRILPGRWTSCPALNWEKSYDPGQGMTSKKNAALFFYGGFSVIPLPPSSVCFQLIYYFADLSGQSYVCRCVSVCLLCGRVRAHAHMWTQRSKKIEFLSFPAVFSLIKIHFNERNVIKSESLPPHVLYSCLYDCTCFTSALQGNVSCIDSFNSR